MAEAKQRTAHYVCGTLAPWLDPLDPNALDKHSANIMSPYSQESVVGIRLRALLRNNATCHVACPFPTTVTWSLDLSLMLLLARPANRSVTWSGDENNPCALDIESAGPSVTERKQSNKSRASMGTSTHSSSVR